jgi:chromosome segregation ATPase
MAELDVGAIRALLREELAPIHAGQDALRVRVDEIAAGQDALRARADKIAAALDAMRPNVDGIPFLQRTLSTVQQEQRMMKAAINEIARTQFTSSEVDALYADVNAVQARDMELQTRLVTLEREIKETKEALAGMNEAVQELRRR